MLASITEWLLVTLFPFVIIVLPILLKKRMKWLRNSTALTFFLFVFSFWVLVVLQRMYIGLPEVMRQSADPMYDGLAVNAIILFFGWIMAIVVSIPFLLVRIGIKYYKESKELP